MPGAEKWRQGVTEGLAVARDVYALRNRLGTFPHTNPMLRGPAHLLKVAENDHFACSEQSSPIRSRIDVLDLKTCKKAPLFGTFSGRVRSFENWIGLVATCKVIVPRDFLELSGSPQHRIIAYEHSQSIPQGVDVPSNRQPLCNPLAPFFSPWRPFFNAST